MKTTGEVRVRSAGIKNVLFVAAIGLSGYFTEHLCRAQAPEASASQDTPPSARAYAPGEETKRLPKHFADGSDLPNGWRITPAGKPIGTLGDMVTNLTASPDGKVVVAVNSGFLPHALTVFDTKTRKQTQHIDLKATFLGMAWSADGHTLFVSGGNSSGHNIKSDPIALPGHKSTPGIYMFGYANGSLSATPTDVLFETIDPKLVWWSGVAYLPAKHLVYAANRGTTAEPTNVVAFDVKTHDIVARIPVETNPYQTVLTPDGGHLFVSNWSSESVSVIDTNVNKVIRTLHVGSNPNDMKMSADGRLFVACSNDNTVYVIDTHTLQVIERISTTLTPLAPEGSTPDALAIDNTRRLLYIANADNNSIAVADIENRVHTSVMGFIPTGWYPSALALADHNHTLYIGNAKGEEGHADLKGPNSPLSKNHPRVGYDLGEETVKSLQTGSIEALPVVDLKQSLVEWTRQVLNDTPYRDSMLSEGPPLAGPSVIPREVGAATPIKHIIYIIKENRTYDQVFGDLPHTNGDPRLTIFGEKVTPNQHALVKDYVILDNLYSDGEVSCDGHSWSTAAYATDFNEKSWPSLYGGISGTLDDVLSNNQPKTVNAAIPSGGYLWDLAKRKGLTYRSYGEFATRSKTGDTMEASAQAPGLIGHVSKDYHNSLFSILTDRDTDRAAVFLREFKGYEENYDSPDPEKQLPNLSVMWMGGDHTVGTRPNTYTPQAMVANNDYAIGQIVDAVSHSRYWPNTAIFIIEDDAQDGSDHVDARRTVGLVISPYVKRGIVDSTLYSTSSMLRSMELLLGLHPMSQYDAAAMPMYSSFGPEPIITPFNVLQPVIDMNAKNTKDSYGAKQSSRMDFSQPDRAPEQALNEIVWKSIKGADSVMPPPVHRFRPLVDVSDSDDDEKHDGKGKDKD
jgi:YVTN family beta-propeller protein